MKALHISGIAIAAIIFSSFVSEAGEITVKNSDVKTVRLFRSGAEVTRTASQLVPAGNTTLLVTGLSPYLDPATVSVEGTSAGKAVILGVSHRLDYTGPEKMLPQVAVLQDSLEVLTRKKTRINSQLSVLQEEQNLILANKNVGGSNTGLKTEDLRSMAAFYRERLTELKDKMVDLSEKEKVLSKEIFKINQQIEELKNRRNPPANTSTLVIEISAATETKASLELRYFTTMAFWSPAYDVRVQDLTSPVSLELKAQVTQDTWEKWDDVKLIISTGNVSSGNTKPELYPWYLNFAQPVPVYDRVMKAEAPAMYDQKVQMDSGAAQGYQIESTQSLTTSQQTAFATEYEIGLPYSIPSDGKSHTVQVKSQKLQAAYKYHAIPKLDKDVFLVAHMTGWQDLGFISGPTSIYYEGAYAGTSYLNTEQTEDTLLVSLGRDPSIAVTREKVKDIEGNKTIGGNRVKEYRFEITVRNTRKESVSVLLHDQLPVSMDKEIEVKATEISGAETDAATGELKWSLEIPSGQSVKKALGFTVKYPKDRQVFNL